MADFSAALPHEICVELGIRARAKRIQLNLSVQELSARIGVSSKTLGNFERTGRCTLETFVRILEALNAHTDLQQVLDSPVRYIEEMRARTATAHRKRAYRKTTRTLQEQQ